MDLTIESISSLIELAKKHNLKSLRLDGLHFELTPERYLGPSDVPQIKGLFGAKVGNPTNEQLLFAATEGFSDDDIMENTQES